MAKYQLLTSTHSDLPAKKEYKRGDIIKSPLDLVKMFPNKFRKVGELPIPDAELLDSKESLDELVAERRKAKIKAQMAEEPQESRKGVGLAREEEARGTEVTSKFDIEDGFHVFQRGSKFHVYKGNSTKPLNEKSLKEDGVESFLKDFLES